LADLERSARHEYNRHWLKKDERSLRKNSTFHRI
jgi:hypothetical protein